MPDTFSFNNHVFNLNGGKNGDKNLSVNLSVLDNLSQPVDAATINAELYLDGQLISSLSGLTGVDGQILKFFNQTSAASGCYVVVILDGTAASTNWDGVNPVNEFCKP